MVIPGQVAPVVQQLLGILALVPLLPALPHITS